jgi:hypothetical protein
MAAENERMTHEQRTERRKQAAAEFKRLMDKGVAVQECYSRVAEEFGITSNTIRQACRENQIEVPRMYANKKKASGRTFEVLAELICGKRPSHIAAERKITHQRVIEIRDEAERAGVFRAVNNLVNAVRTVGK